VIRAIRGTSPVPIIVLSVRNDERGKVEALDLGADDYITKPFDPDELLKTIQSVAVRAWEKSHTEQGKDEKRIRFACRCGKRFKVSPMHRGKMISCPECGEPVTVPHRV
jgi:two-component system, OmpR family, response regulator